MHADLRGIHLNLEATQAFEHLFANSVCFSDIVMAMAYERGDAEDELVSKRAYGQLLRSFFDSTRRTVDVGHMPYYIELESPGDSQPTQVGLFKIMCDTTMPARDFEALCSAMTLTQTTKKLSLQLTMDRERQASYEHWWKWLAYALFSKRAQACSSIESVIIPGLEQLTAAEVRAFTSIVTSEHPEETLFGTPRGVVDERDATLTSGAPIRWQFDDEGQPVLDSQLLTLETSIPFVRTFSDDGEREWVNVLVPGFGRCQVQRWNLEFHDKSEDKSGSPALASLTMELYLNDMALVDGVVPFYETIGSSLKFLKIHGPPFAGPHDVNVNTIIRSCPNLQELTLSRALVGLEFDLRSYRASNTPIPELSIPWIDVVQLAKDLSDPNNELTKCVRRLRASVETLPLPIPDAEPVIPPRFQVSVDSLLSMLKANERLEYVRVQAEYTDPLGDFIKYDMKPIYRQYEPFPIKCKAALLSVTQSRDMQAKGEKKRKVGAVQPKLALGQIDPHVLSNIFAFAAEPILRRVFFDQIKYGNHEHHEHHHHHQHQQEEQE